MKEAKKLTDEELEKRIESKYGKDWDLAKILETNSDDKLIGEFIERATKTSD